MDIFCMAPVRERSHGRSRYRYLPGCNRLDRLESGLHSRFSGRSPRVSRRPSSRPGVRSPARSMPMRLARACRGYAERDDRQPPRHVAHAGIRLYLSSAGQPQRLSRRNAGGERLWCGLRRKHDFSNPILTPQAPNGFGFGRIRSNYMLVTVPVGFSRQIDRAAFGRLLSCSGASRCCR